MNKKINSLIVQVKTLKGIIDQMQALINFQTYQNKLMVDLGVKREKEVINLNRQIYNLENELIIEQDVHASIVKLAEQKNGS